MDLDQFCQFVATALEARELSHQFRVSPLPCTKTFRRKVNDEPFSGLFVQWEAGGSDGGNYSGGESRRYTCSEKTPGLSGLEAVLEDACPEMSFRVYLELCKMVQEGSWLEQGYYGNWTDYAYACLPMQALYGFLQDGGYIPSVPCKPL